MPRGYNESGDVVTQTADGRPLNDLWAQFQESLRIANESRTRIVDFLTFPVTQVIEDVPQAGGTVDFELATEFGEPVGVKTKLEYFSMAYDFAWYDVAGRFTWQYLLEATAAQVESVNNAVIEADNRNLFTKVMKTVFNPTNLSANINNQNYTVFKFYNNDGTVPPPYKTNVHLGTHTHYYGSGAATVDPGDLQELQTHLNHHGYTESLGYRLVLMVNKAQGDTIRTFRMGTAGALFDFIPARGREDLLFLSSTQVLGVQPPPTIDGLEVIGKYGDLLIVQDDYIPAGYMFGFATGGEANLANPIGFREHAQASVRGLNLVKGRTPDYPLIDSFYTRGFGTGVRQRGGGVVVQIVASATYTPPAAYA